MPLALALMLCFGAAPGDALERARVCWAALDSECAGEALGEARSSLDERAPDEQLEVLRLSAELELSGGQDAAARPHIEAALTRQPAWAPAWPEAWRAVLEDVRKTMPDRLPPTIVVEAPTSVPPKKAVRLMIIARDPSGIASVVVAVGDERYTAMTADGERWSIEVPKAMVKLPDLMLTIVVHDRANNRADHSHVIPVVLPPKPADPPITSRWWFWTAIGAGVAALTATAIVLASDGDEPVSGPGVGGIDILPKTPGLTP